jgi:hypothetical protein
MDASYEKPREFDDPIVIDGAEYSCWGMEVGICDNLRLFKNVKLRVVVKYKKFSNREHIRNDKYYEVAIKKKCDDDERS